MAGLITLGGIAFIFIISFSAGMFFEWIERARVAAERAIEDQEIRLLQTRAAAKEVKELHVSAKKQNRVYSQLLRECGEVVDDDYWVDPAAARNADKIIPQGFQAVSTCVVCGEYATHWLEKVDGRDIVRKCINEKCQGTWTERK